MDYYDIGQRIRASRKEKQLSQEQLAENVGISTTHMSHIETGNTKLSLEVFAQLVTVLGARADELLFGKKEVTEEQLISEMQSLLSDCSTAEKNIISDIAKATKASLKKNVR